MICLQVLWDLHSSDGTVQEMEDLNNRKIDFLFVLFEINLIYFICFPLFLTNMVQQADVSQ